MSMDISPLFGCDGEGVPTCSVIPVMIFVFPIVVREDPWVFRVKMEGRTVVFLAV